MFGACVECLTDQVSKFKGEFLNLFDHTLIDHLRTSRDHPQANGLVERMVHVATLALGSRPRQRGCKGAG